MKRKEDLLQIGLLIFRVGIGISILLHGLPKLTGGVEMWTYIGGSMSIFGITFAPAFWGFMAAVAESVGGLLFALGLFFRPAAILLTGTMIVALATHLQPVMILWSLGTPWICLSYLQHPFLLVRVDTHWMQS